MPIKDVTLKARSCEVDRDGKFTATHEWSVEGTDRIDDEFQTFNAALVALAEAYNLDRFGIGASHPTAVAFVNRLQMEQASDDGMVYTLTIEFGEYVSDVDNPLEQPPEWEWGNETRNEIVDFDRDGNHICNSAGDPFDPPVTRDYHARTLTITRNERTFDPSLADYYQDTVNEFEFFGAPAGTVLCDSITGRRAWHSHPVLTQQSGVYWIVTYHFRGRREGWAVRLLDQGLRHLSGSTRKQILIDGEPATAPVPLDGAGNVLSPTAQAVAITAHVNELRDFRELGLEPPPEEEPVPPIPPINW